MDCVYVSQSATSISTAIKYAESAGYTANDIDWTLDGHEKGVEGEEGAEPVDSLVQFEHTNPGMPLYKIAVIKNNRYMYMYMEHLYSYIHCTCTCIYVYSILAVHVQYVCTIHVQCTCMLVMVPYIL